VHQKQKINPWSANQEDDRGKGDRNVFAGEFRGFWPTYGDSELSTPHPWKATERQEGFIRWGLSMMVPLKEGNKLSSTKDSKSGSANGKVRTSLSGWV
jgi:hypothetical protein